MHWYWQWYWVLGGEKGWRWVQGWSRTVLTTRPDKACHHAFPYWLGGCRYVISGLLLCSLLFTAYLHSSKCFTVRMHFFPYSSPQLKQEVQRGRPQPKVISLKVMELGFKPCPASNPVLITVTLSGRPASQKDGSPGKSWGAWETYLLVKFVLSNVKISNSLSRQNYRRLIFSRFFHAYCIKRNILTLLQYLLPEMPTIVSFMCVMIRT